MTISEFNKYCGETIFDLDNIVRRLKNLVYNQDISIDDALDTIMCEHAPCTYDALYNMLCDLHELRMECLERYSDRQISVLGLEQNDTWFKQRLRSIKIKYDTCFYIKSGYSKLVLVFSNFTIRFSKLIYNHQVADEFQIYRDMLVYSMHKSKIPFNAIPFITFYDINGTMFQIMPRAKTCNEADTIQCREQYYDWVKHIYPNNDFHEDFKVDNFGIYNDKCVILDY